MNIPDILEVGYSAFHGDYRWISEGTLAISMEATVKEIASIIHPHPTVSEAFMEAALKAMGKAIHTL